MTVLAFPQRRREGHGCVHVWLTDESQFEIGHESASGGSWGFFETFSSPGEAVAAAYDLNRKELAGSCDINISPEVLELLPTATLFQSGLF